MTKAERLFNKNYYECKKHIKVWGFEGVGFNDLELKKQALEMLQITLSNQRKVNEEWKAI